MPRQAVGCCGSIGLNDSQYAAVSRFWLRF
jgi:hypothetical protein